jgi:hypothetical protein
MINGDRQKFDSILIALAEMFEQQISETRLDLYFEALRDISIEDFQKAANVVARSGRFFPKPIDFREAVHGSLDDKALQALMRLEDAVKRIGQYKSVVFDDSVIHMAVQALDGWQAVCLLQIDEWKWKRKEFLSLYKSYAVNPCQYPEKLIGYHDHKNTINGHPENIGKPVLIGDQHKAMAVLTHKQSEAKGNNPNVIELARRMIAK